MVQVWSAETSKVVKEFPGACLVAEDVEAFAEGPPRYPWYAVPDELGTAIRSRKDDRVVAWCPYGNLRIMPSGRSWISIDGTVLHVFTLRDNRPSSHGMSAQI